MSETLQRPPIHPTTVTVPEFSIVPERLVVAPCSGRFTPLPTEIYTTDGEWVEPGQQIGRVDAGRETVEVRSPFRGWMMGMLALPGQRVREGEALFWVRSC